MLAFDNTGGRATGIALSNSSGQPAVVAATLRDSTGATLAATARAGRHAVRANPAAYRYGPAVGLGGKVAHLTTMTRYFETAKVRIEMRLLGHVAHALLKTKQIAAVGRPSKKISPDVVSISPVIIFMVVDLPDP